MENQQQDPPHLEHQLMEGLIDKLCVSRCSRKFCSNISSQSPNAMFESLRSYVDLLSQVKILQKHDETSLKAYDNTMDRHFV